MDVGSKAEFSYERLNEISSYIWVPLSLKASRCDQIQNAWYFEKLGLVLSSMEMN